MTNLITAIPFNADMNLGQAYNDVMRRLEDDDWCCFIDHDVMFTTKYWHEQILYAINNKSYAGIFTCYTNRIANRTQFLSIEQQSHNISYHRMIGNTLRQENIGSISDITHGPLISGMLLCMSKKVWLKIGGFKDGFLGVDNRAHKDVRDIGYKVYRIDGLYVYHWYRADGTVHEGAPICKM